MKLDKRGIENILGNFFYTDILNRIEHSCKQTAKAMLDIVADKVSDAHIPMKQFDWFKEVAREYGVEVNK